MNVTGELGTYNVRIKGEGNVTVLLECGMMRTLNQWNYLQEELSKVARVIAYDRLGYGKSGKWTSNRTIEQQAFECYDLLLALDINTPLVAIGHSLGAYITIKLHQLFPKRIQSIILLDPTHPYLEENEHKLHDQLLYSFALFMKRANQLKLFKALPNFFIREEDDMEVNDKDIMLTFKNKMHWKTVVDEWNNLDYSNQLINEVLKNRHDTPLLVLTAGKKTRINKKKQKQLLSQVEKYHHEFSNTSKKGQQITLDGFNHADIYGNNQENAKRISEIIIEQIKCIE